MTEQEYKKFFKKNFWRTSSFTSGAALMLIDCISVMLCIGISFFIVNLINNSWINFRSFVNYWVYLPPMMAVFYAAGLYPDAVYAIGNAPTALITLSELIRKGFRPALVIGVPVGFVNVTESKDEALEVCAEYGVPAIIAMGRKGGSTIAAALVNALLYEASGNVR